MKRERTVSVCMIVKNEERFLGRCLESVKDLVDEIIVVDTGSKDKTVEIAESFGAKVYYYQWDNSFANARNFSLSKATKDWILILDGDDEFEKEDREKFIDIVNNSKYDGHFFKTLSLNSEADLKNYTCNLNLRLIKNTGEYEYVGAIHEQINNKIKPMDYGRFPSEEIRIYHRGYIPAVTQAQNKRERNMNILREELKKDPFNGFVNFNMGNEYFALGDVKSALEHFDTGYKAMDPRQGYGNKLALRRILALIALKRYNMALEAIDEGLEFYPNFTELIYYKGEVYEKQKKYTMAVKTYEKAIEQGESPIYLTFLNGCATFRAYYNIAEIYYSLGDYEEAIINYKKAILCDKSFWPEYTGLAKSYFKILEDEKETVKKLKIYFDLENKGEVVILSMILMEAKLYNGILEELNDKLNAVETDQSVFVLGKCLFNTKEYIKAYYQFRRLPKESPYYELGIIYIIIIKILTNKEVYEEDFDKITNDVKRKSIMLMNSIAKDEKITIDDLPEEYLSEIINILDIILSTNDFQLFEKMLNSLNYINSNKVLLELAKLYHRYGYNSLAVQEITRSFKEFEVIDEVTLDIFYKNLFI
ncbi:TPR domain-containing glycosyltransferase [Clostridium sp. ATCC 25772]|uniref:tetratricopeptide repeat-containing glycosyltransferase family 2 protein n=1 Tax=Clostridium sp. ATCC 25772 TaxID=1676991 RepID=UPI0007855624|nr:TPR domain-containing glycosyltransferase [Clostridium sp. ATCC 25772]